MTYQDFRDWAIECVANNHAKVGDYLMENVELELCEYEEGERMEIYGYEGCVECMAQTLADEHYPKIDELSDVAYGTLVGMLYDEIQNMFPEDEIKSIVLANYDEANDFYQTKLSASNGTWR